jgi:hypothetical protein
MYFQMKSNLKNNRYHNTKRVHKWNRVQKAEIILLRLYLRLWFNYIFEDFLIIFLTSN